MSGPARAGRADQARAAPSLEQRAAELLALAEPITANPLLPADVRHLVRAQAELLHELAREVEQLKAETAADAAYRRMGGV